MLVLQPAEAPDKGLHLGDILAFPTLHPSRKKGSQPLSDSSELRSSTHLRIRPLDSLRNLVELGRDRLEVEVPQFAEDGILRVKRVFLFLGSRSSRRRC